MMNTALLIEEIVAKECERYELEKNHFIANRKEVIGMLCKNVKSNAPSANCSTEEFCLWKEQLLAQLYTQQNFSGFLHKRINDTHTYSLIRRLMKNFITILRKNNPPETIDHELKLPSRRTVAFKLSSPLFATIYPQILSEQHLFTSPGQMEERCESLGRTLFPLDYSKLQERLAAKDDEFWEEIWNIVRQFVNCLLLNRSTSADKEEATKEVSMEAILSLQEQMEEAKFSSINTATHLLHSLRRTCRNKLHEFLYRHNKRKEALLDETEWNRIEEELICHSQFHEGHNESDPFDYLLELDENNEYELCCAIVDVLCHREGELYRKLIGSESERVEVLLMHYVKQLTYEDIAKKLYGEANPQRISALRQSVKRIKGYLKKRMKELVIEYKQTFSI